MTIAIKQLQYICLLTFIALRVFPVHSAEGAAIQCYQCHGTQSPIDYRPLDSSYRDASSGGFQGNHRTHMAVTTTPLACAKCHPNSNSYTPSHRDGLIKVSARINASPQTTAYKNSTSAFHQTPNPFPGNCTNINCHFETGTPTWGSPTFNSTSQCTQCHEGIVPLSATHATHKRYSTGLMGKFSTYAACSSCHVNYATPPNFTHATSAGSHPINISVGGYNSGSMTYLPSQAHGPFGTCSNLYCHSPGTKGAAPFNAPILTATWESTLSADCTGCHKGSATSFKWMSSASHNRHVSPNMSGAHRIDCVKCHASTVNKGLVIKDVSKHVDGTVQVSFNNTSTAVNGKYNGYFAPVSKNPGTAYGSCENVYCHSNGQNNGGSGITYKQPIWGNSATGNCGKCHDAIVSHGGSSISQISTGSHTKHLSNISATIASSDLRKCILCHNVGNLPWAANSCTNTCHAGLAKHVDHQINIAIPTELGATATYDGSPNPGSGYSSCSNTYCHSNGTSLATGIVPANTSTVWGSGVIPCSGCHGFPPAYGSGLPKGNSHTAHAALGYGCNTCHAATTGDGTTITSTTLHINRSYDLSPGTGISFSYVFHTNGSTCSNISCHNNGSAVWGTTLTCGDCHSVSPGGD